MSSSEARNKRRAQYKSNPGGSNNSKYISDHHAKSIAAKELIKSVRMDIGRRKIDALINRGIKLNMPNTTKMQKLAKFLY